MKSEELVSIDCTNGFTYIGNVIKNNRNSVGIIGVENFIVVPTSKIVYNIKKTEKYETVLKYLYESNTHSQRRYEFKSINNQIGVIFLEDE